MGQFAHGKVRDAAAFTCDLAFLGAFRNSPGYFQTSLAGPASFERFTLDQFMSIQPGLGVGIHHKHLPKSSYHPPKFVAQETPTNCKFKL